ncbi:Peptidase M23 [Candidatus Liberibacter solanacearum CLso-ZC1]|uniref:Peptidase M23 n=1 Tax=Liberibacter solanacearum (strain CLso-ZC1) TaxID=658172 RepID=E4UCW8_LIBSC|nr:M23 family metallopeptidase [Candidatus Liberibacter solanacearum]ADR52208.1 Peptidase M23 [Candidatus Liberibacter solanacearum CLso-ZC1]
MNVFYRYINKYYKILAKTIFCFLLILVSTSDKTNAENILVLPSKITNYHNRLVEQKNNPEKQVIPIPLPTKQEYPSNTNNKTIDQNTLLAKKGFVDKNNLYSSMYLSKKIPLPNKCLLFPPDNNSLHLNNCIENKSPNSSKKNISHTRKIPKYKKNNPKKSGNIAPAFKVKNNQKIKHIQYKKNNYSPQIHPIKNQKTKNNFPKSTVKTIENNQNKSEGYLWPVKGNIVNFVKNNNGIDVLVPPNTPIRAAKDGIVIYVGNDLIELGDMILIRHDNEMVTVYSHINTPYVQKGQKVSRGHTIGISRISDDKKISKVHFELRQNAIAVDPIAFLEKTSYTQKSDQ